MRQVNIEKVFTRYHSWCFLNSSQVLFTGGEFSGVTTNLCWIIDLDTWVAVAAASMTARRQDHFILLNEGVVYAFGGDNGK